VTEAIRELKALVARDLSREDCLRELDLWLATYVHEARHVATVENLALLQSGFRLGGVSDLMANVMRQSLCELGTKVATDMAEQRTEQSFRMDATVIGSRLFVLGKRRS
jgi:hypothetical protein